METIEDYMLKYDEGRPLVVSRWALDAAYAGLDCLNLEECSDLIETDDALGHNWHLLSNWLQMAYDKGFADAKEAPDAQ